MLRPVLAELAADHETVAAILRPVEELIGGGAGPDPAATERLRSELDGLTALLESHFGYEEKKLVTALNALDAPRRKTEELLGIQAPAALEG